jgi:hypothetical protein
VANPTAAPVLSLLPLARHLGYGFLPVPRVYLATIAVAAGYPPGGCPHPSQRGVQPFRRREPAAGTAGADRTDPGFSRLAGARRSRRAKPRSRCAENRKSVLIRYARFRCHGSARSSAACSSMRLCVKSILRLRRVPLTPHPRRPYVGTFGCPLRAQLWVRHLVLRGRS